MEYGSAASSADDAEDDLRAVAADDAASTDRGMIASHTATATCTSLDSKMGRGMTWLMLMTIGLNPLVTGFRIGYDEMPNAGADVAAADGGCCTHLLNEDGAHCAAGRSLRHDDCWMCHDASADVSADYENPDDDVHHLNNRCYHGSYGYYSCETRMDSDVGV